MCVFGGRAGTIDVDRAMSERLLEETLVDDRPVDKGFVGDHPNSSMNESTPDGGCR